MHRGGMPYHVANNLAGMALMESGFWIFIVEGVLALGLAVFIVWWTWPKKK
jgi:hypothetical protein